MTRNGNLIIANPMMYPWYVRHIQGKLCPLRFIDTLRARHGFGINGQRIRALRLRVWALRIAPDGLGFMA